MNTAMVLCAGFGTRMKDLTRDTPKPMLPLGGRPMLEFTIRHLAGLGITNIVINLHFMADKITSYFGTGEKWGVKINYTHEDTPLGTAGAVKNAEHLLSKADDFLVLYGDVICNQNYQDVFKLHKSKSDSKATIVLHERLKSNSVVEMNGENKIIRFIERPKEEVKDKKQNWVNSGLYLFSNTILQFIPEKTFCDFPKDIFSSLVSKGEMYGFPLNGYRCAIDSPERYSQLLKDFDLILNNTNKGS